MMTTYIDLTLETCKTYRTDNHSAKDRYLGLFCARVIVHSAPSHDYSHTLPYAHS